MMTLTDGERAIINALQRGLIFTVKLLAAILKADGGRGGDHGGERPSGTYRPGSTEPGNDAAGKAAAKSG